MTYPARIVSSPARFAQRVRRLARGHPHFVLIAIVFVTFRLLMPLGFTSLGPDIGDFIRWGTLADSRLYPYIDYWSEYPPLLGWSIIGLYRLSTLVPAWSQDPRFWFGLVLKLATALFDVGSLCLVYAIALRLGSRARAVRTAALFAGGFITAYAAWGWLDGIPLFFLLLALYASLRDRPIASACAAAVGILIKVVPIVIVPIALRRIPNLSRRAMYLVALGAIVIALMLPFLIANASTVLAFVQGTFSRPTWGSFWAALEGNYQFGFVAPVSERFSLESAGVAAPGVLPWPIIHLAFAGLFLYLYTRRIDWRDSTQAVAFAGLTANLFLLWSRGFSGQFTVYAFPFILLLLPNRRGALYAGLLSVAWIAEWPMALLITLDGPQTPKELLLLWIILVRTAILIALCLEYAALLFPRATARLSRVAAAVLTAGWISVLPTGIAFIDTYTRTQLAADPAAPAVYLIRDGDNRPDKTIVFAAARIFRRLYPLARSTGDTLLLPLAEHVPEDVRLAWLAEQVARGSFWFIADEGDPGTRAENLAAESWLSEHACKVETQIAGSARVSRFIGRGETPLDAQAVFADEIALVGARMSARSLRAGDGLCVELDWQSLTQPTGDYTIFVHLIDANGRLVAQNDMPPRGGFAPTGGWPADSTLSDPHGLTLPGDVPPGEYTLRVGMYRSDNQAPVPVTQGNRLLPDARGIVLADLSVAP
jgi:hypothetical protein